jgi:NADH:ubiquinone oxidoreductase subunit F (NADH-binding)/NAD-dependent dihydropyrimidine dehydrogenase PreA subunit/(2Fe-2S) ferredoxin
MAAGAQAVYDALADEIRQSGLTDVKVVGTGCVGLCFYEPLVEVRVPGREPVFFGEVDEERARALVNTYLAKGEDVAGKLIDEVREENGAQVNDFAAFHFAPRIVLRNCGVIDPDSLDDYISAEGYQALGKALTQMQPSEVVAEVKASGLRGRGGAGFPTGLKWEIAAGNPGDVKYVVCNADEGDPGAFMDRSVLEGDPHSVLEAMAICGYSIGASNGIIYIRAEYPLAVARLRKAISDAESAGLLGDNILGTGFNFNISLSLGAGAFVCGEETALINSIQGLRGEPSTKPPFPAQRGVWGKPTNINNVETFASICPIILKGSKWFASIGTEGSKGTKVFALAGKVNKVGLVEVPMGTTLRDIIYTIGGGIKDGKAFKAVQTGGPSGGCIPAEHLDMQVDYDSLKSIGSIMGSGGMIVLDEDDCMPNIARFFLDFIVDESCGRCTPCRIGTMRMHEILTRITKGQGKPEDLDKLGDLARTIQDTALCGLGQTAPNPVLSTLNFFRDEYLAHVVDHTCPAKSCKDLLEYHIDPEKCNGCTVCARNCPTDCITGERKAAHTIDQENCIKCGTCLDKCKFGAITLV